MTNVLVKGKDFYVTTMIKDGRIFGMVDDRMGFDICNFWCDITDDIGNAALEAIHNHYQQ
jgi:hypothetical protein